MTLQEFIEEYQKENTEFFEEHDQGEHDTIDDFRNDNGDSYDMLFYAKGYHDCLEDLKTFVLKENK